MADYRGKDVYLQTKTNEMNMKPQEMRNERLAKTVIKNLQRRHMEGFYCATAEEAVRKVS